MRLNKIKTKDPKGLPTAFIVRTDLHLLLYTFTWSENNRSCNTRRTSCYTMRQRMTLLQEIMQAHLNLSQRRPHPRGNEFAFDTV